MKKIPFISTLIVLLAVAAMVSLGIWQLGRAEEKGAALARYDANLAAEPLRVGDRIDLSADLFRRAEATCQPGGTWLSGAGRLGYRLLASCRTLEGGQPLTVQLGITRDLHPQASWKGGRVTGYLTEAPDNRSVLRQAFDRTPATPMIVADPPLEGLAASPGPSIAEVPNNHRSYAVQWFAFAGLALLIYALALRKRREVEA